MRRVLGAVLLLVLVSGCAATERPEGLVERWLASLDQGRAGQPERYASDALSERVLPHWRTLDPGELDVIEVGRGGSGEGAMYQVPFRIVTIDGAELRALANVQGGTITGIVTSHQTPIANDLFPSNGGPSLGSTSASTWLAAVGAAALFVLMSALLMGLVRRRERSGFSP